MTRLAKILAHIDLRRSRGLEFGPLMSPLIARGTADIFYVDRAPREELVRWYAENPTIDPAQIVDVDYIWGDRTLKECVGAENVFDFCVASHVMEHVPDLATWLEEVSAVLRDEGILSVVLPDKRYTFDCLRPPTTVVDVVDAYVNRLRRPSSRQIFDHFSHFVEVDAAALWRQNAESLGVRATGDDRNLVKICREAREQGTYIDSHCWVFTPLSFLDLLTQMAKLGLVQFEVASFTPTTMGENEFFVSLRKLPDRLTPDEKAAVLAGSVEALRPVAEGRPGGEASERAESAALAAEVAALRRELETIRTSRSWRLTEPLRSAVRTLRRYRHGGR
jgi:hypothetical protein